ncbi:MAG: hypothetical protein ACR2PH_05645, partial [Desulfobulbia bacterium]
AMNIIYKHQIPVLRNYWLKTNCKHKLPTFLRWDIKHNAKRAMKRRLPYNDACKIAHRNVKNSEYGQAFSYLIDLSDRIKRVSREFPNQPILLDETDMDYIFLNISKKDLDNRIKSHVEYYAGKRDK